jgi:hypothetical protein
MVGINDVSIDLADCELVEQSAHHRRWRDGAGVEHVLRLSAAPPWTFDLTNPKACAAYFGKKCADAGGWMLSMDVAEVGGCEALAGVFKYSPGKMHHPLFYVAALWIPLSDCLVHLNIESLERGTTGVRESMVTVMQLLGPGEGPLSSDAELYDRGFPSHPLTQVRQRLRQVLETFRLSADPASLAPFRYFVTH